VRESVGIAEPTPPGLARLDHPPRAGRERAGTLRIEGYASLWGVADLNGDVVAEGAFAASLARSGAGGVRMLHLLECRAAVGVWDEVLEDARASPDGGTRPAP
jgi:phage head maturation protease